MMNDLLALSNRLPTKIPVDHAARIKHCIEHGHIVCLIDNGEVVGYAEVYLLNKPPQYPVIPWPISNPNGEYMYCYAAVCKPGRIKELIKLGKKTFAHCKWLCYHRRKHNNRLHIERI